MTTLLNIKQLSSSGISYYKLSNKYKSFNIDIHKINELQKTVLISNVISSCKLPTKHGLFNLDIHKIDKLEIPVLTSNIISNNIVNVRIHDACITSEVFNSLKCDCDSQLQMSMNYINHKSGLIIYLPNEGRGIGLANKIKAYNIQDTLNLDTYDSNTHLNLPEDNRDYSCVKAILNHYKIESINLLTNSKVKLEKLKEYNIKINSTIPMITLSNPVNRDYINTKNKKNIHKHQEYSYDSVYATVEEAIEELKNNKPIILVDNEDRENEGDLIFPAENITTEMMAFIIKYTSGLICCALSREIVDNLDLKLMISEDNNLDPHQTAFTISLDYKIGTTTGISAYDRALTCRKLTEEKTLKNFNYPGHIYPLRANKDGLKARQGHTEASTYICKLAGFKSAAVISEITTNNKLKMANKNELEKLAINHNLKIAKISDLVKLIN